MRTGLNAEVSVVHKSDPDFAVENHLSLFIVRPLTDAANAWLDENVVNPETMWFGGGLVCEPRYVADLVAGMREAGLIVVG